MTSSKISNAKRGGRPQCRSSWAYLVVRCGPRTRQRRRPPRHRGMSRFHARPNDRIVRMTAKRKHITMHVSGGSLMNPVRRQSARATARSSVSITRIADEDGLLCGLIAASTAFYAVMPLRGTISSGTNQARRKISARCSSCQSRSAAGAGSRPRPERRAGQWLVVVVPQVDARTKVWTALEVLAVSHLLPAPCV